MMNEPMGTTTTQEQRTEQAAQPAVQETLSQADVEQRMNELAAALTKRMEEKEQADRARAEALNAREECLNRREIIAKTREALQSHGLPAALADLIVFQDEEAMIQGVAMLENAFRAAVQQGVEERLTAADTPKNAPVLPLSELPDEEYYAATYRGM